MLVGNLYLWKQCNFKQKKMRNYQALLFFAKTNIVSTIVSHIWSYYIVNEVQKLIFRNFKTLHCPKGKKYFQKTFTAISKTIKFLETSNSFLLKYDSPALKYVYIIYHFFIICLPLWSFLSFAEVCKLSSRSFKVIFYFSSEFFNFLTFIVIKCSL